MKAVIKRIGTDDIYYYNVGIGGEAMGVFMLDGFGVWGFSSSAGSKTVQQHEAIGLAFKDLHGGFPEHSEIEHLKSMGWSDIDLLGDNTKKIAKCDIIGETSQMG